MKKKLLLPFVLLAFACTPPDPALKISLKTDDLSNEAIITGPAEHNASGTQWELKGFVNKAKETAHYQLYVTAKYTGTTHKIFNHAQDEDKKRLRLNHVLRTGKPCQKASCKLGEVMTVDLRTTALESHRDKDYTVTLTAKDGSAIPMLIPAVDIRALLIATGKYTAPQEK